MPAPNITVRGKKLLKQALAQIKAEPQTFDMGLWMTHDKTVRGKEPLCGTVACLAGHIVLAAGVNPHKAFEEDGGDKLKISGLPTAIRPMAREFVQKKYAWNLPPNPHTFKCISISDLAILLMGRKNDSERLPAMRLFDMGAWETTDFRAYINAADHEGRFKILTERVKYWLRTGK